MGKAICKTCGAVGPPWHHVPTILAPNHGDTPVPLSADSLREQWFDILEKAGFNENERLVIERLTKPYIAAALQAERQRIADSLPKPEEIKVQQYFDTLDQKHAMMLVDYQTGWNKAIEAVRAVLIPPTPEDKTINATFYKTDLDAGLGDSDVTTQSHPGST